MTSRIDDIKRNSGGLPVLLLEGPDDVEFFTYMFEQYLPERGRGFWIDYAEGKKRVKSFMSIQTDWVGIVDRDEWSQADVNTLLKDTPNLHILPRFCIESFFCHPGELWEALPSKQKVNIGINFDSFNDLFNSVLPDWVKHGALWRVLRDYDELHLPEQLDTCPVPDRNELLAILRNWHQRLSPEEIINKFDVGVHEGQKLGLDQQFKHYIHGKRFYNEFVVQTLDRLLSGKGADWWKQKLYGEKIRPPGDLIPLLDWVINKLLNKTGM